MAERDLLIGILTVAEEQKRLLEELSRNQERASKEQIRLISEIVKLLTPPPLPTAITFTQQGDDLMALLPTEGGNTLIYTGTLTPAGSTFPADATFTVISTDPAVLPTVDVTGLIVTIPLPSGWVESTTTPLAVSYAAASASNPTWTLSATITPSAPPAPLPTAISFTQTT